LLQTLDESLILGSCYIFSGILALESAVAIEYNTPPVKLSAQHTLNCLKNLTGEEDRDACNGGRFVLSFSTISQTLKDFFQS
jgi:Papain family cysteine protease